MALAFSSSDQAAIDRTVDLSTDDVKPAADDSELEFKYEVKRSVAWICENGFRKVALQFPDEMLVDSVSVTLALQASVPAELFILGDTSYGSCCVDEVAAEHVGADAIVHYGHSCLSVPSRLPVLFIFGRLPCTTEGLEQGLHNVFPDPDARIAVLFDTQYDHCKCDVFAKISALFRNAVCSELVIPSVQQDVKNCSRGTHVITKCSRTFCIPENTSLEDHSILFIGPENRTLTNIVFTFNNCACYSYDPKTRETRRESLTVNRQLMRRYYLIEKAKDASIVGILAGTLGVQNYLSAIGHLKKLIRNAGKKPYTLVTGKLNVAKLANFQEIDVYVLVACPENTLLDSKEFFRPIVTPFELELALNPSRQWSQTFSASFSDILPGGELYLELEEQSSQPEYDVSLVTGKIRSLGVEGKADDEGSTTGGTLVAKEGTVAVPQLHIAAAGEYLMNRTWQGLETRLGQTPAATISKGQVGLAAGYVGEGEGGHAQM
ncbi:2-(3-amino-3-carboxypropyl)histidine synthase subunit 2 [Rhipicephalus sanguineus]|uniref:2-(3-amino-3-carboxypropyl)histidine synthase subunit 2 n=1 Tax=Rhipicephalus sanguineus TaxID=34632 RepID=UPI0018930E09|nr:2-(3-amino-3-carboxypropyl)histidine synthase subunit 2 [Rhipicephalus sanguineus]